MQSPSNVAQLRDRSDWARSSSKPRRMKGVPVQVRASALRSALGLLVERGAGEAGDLPVAAFVRHRHRQEGSTGAGVDDEGISPFGPQRADVGFFGFRLHRSQGNGVSQLFEYPGAAQIPALRMGRELFEPDDDAPRHEFASGGPVAFGAGVEKAVQGDGCGIAFGAVGLFAKFLDAVVATLDLELRRATAGVVVVLGSVGAGVARLPFAAGAGTTFSAALFGPILARRAFRRSLLGAGRGRAGAVAAPTGSQAHGDEQRGKRHNQRLRSPPHWFSF